MVHHRSLAPGHSAPFVDYYVNQARGRPQAGGALPYFAGARSSQSGSGLGSIFSSIFSKVKSALPWFFKTVAKNALQSGANVASDLLEGKSIKEAAKDRGLEGLKSVAGDVAPRALEAIKESIREDKNQSGTGKRQRTIRRPPKKVKRLKRDIFD